MLNGTGDRLGFCEKWEGIAKLCENGTFRHLMEAQSKTALFLAFHFGKKFIQGNDLCIIFPT